MGWCQVSLGNLKQKSLESKSLKTAMQPVQTVKPLPSHFAHERMLHVYVIEDIVEVYFSQNAFFPISLKSILMLL